MAITTPTWRASAAAAVIFRAASSDSLFLSTVCASAPGATASISAIPVANNGPSYTMLIMFPVVFC